MDNTHTASLGNSLFQALEEIRQAKGAVTVEDAGVVLEQLLESSFEKKPVYLEMAQIVKDIEEAKNEILTLSVNKHSNEKALLEASQHLNTVIKSTEEATLSFLNEADNIRRMAEGIGGEKEDAINAACTRICELCSFQDLTGQRVTKVLKLIQGLETHIMNLLTLFRINSSEVRAPRSLSISEQVSDENLLNGPQLPGDAMGQDAVDALLNSFK